MRARDVAPRRVGTPARAASSVLGLVNCGVSVASAKPSRLAVVYAFSPPADVSGCAFADSPVVRLANLILGQVLTAAKNVAQAFNEVASKLQQSTAQVDMQLKSTTSQINNLAAQVVKFNTLIRNGQGDNAGLQSNLYNTLQQLSSLTSVDVHLETDGTVTLLMGGQVPLVVGVTQATLRGAPAPSRSARGEDHPRRGGQAERE